MRFWPSPKRRSPRSRSPGWSSRSTRRSARSGTTRRSIVKAKKRAGDDEQESRWRGGSWRRRYALPRGRSKPSVGATHGARASVERRPHACVFRRAPTKPARLPPNEARKVTQPARSPRFDINTSNRRGSCPPFAASPWWPCWPHSGCTPSVQNAPPVHPARGQRASGRLRRSSIPGEPAGDPAPQRPGAPADLHRHPDGRAEGAAHPLRGCRRLPQRPGGADHHRLPAAERGRTRPGRSPPASLDLDPASFTGGVTFAVMELSATGDSTPRRRSTPLPPPTS